MDFPGRRNPSTPPSISCKKEPKEAFESIDGFTSEYIFMSAAIVQWLRLANNGRRLKPKPRNISPFLYCFSFGLTKEGGGVSVAANIGRAAKRPRPNMTARPSLLGVLLGPDVT